MFLARVRLTIRLTLLLGALWPTGIHAQEPSVLEIAQQWEAAIRSRDVDAALALFADDAVVSLGTGLPTAELLIGTDRIRPWVEALASGPPPSGADSQGRQVNRTGNVVSWTTQFHHPEWQR